MAKSREQLEAEINNTTYFSINGDNTEALKKTELYKLSAVVFEYCNNYLFAKNDKASCYGLEIYNCTIQCLKNFDPNQSTSFLHYLNAALSRNIKKAALREEKTKTRLGQYQIINDSDKNYSLIESQPSAYSNPIDELLDKEEKSEKRDAIQKILKTVGKVYLNKQDRIKPYLKKLITREYFDAIISFYDSFPFVDMEMIKAAKFNKINLPTQKEIAKSFGRVEQDASRTIANFNKAVRKIVMDRSETCLVPGASD